MFDIDWQGTQADRREDARRRGERLHPAALDGGAEGPARAPRRGRARGDRPPPAQRARRDRPVGILRLRAGQRRSRPHLRRPQGDPGGRAPEARAPDRHGRASSSGLLASSGLACARRRLSRVTGCGPTHWPGRRNLRPAPLRRGSSPAGLLRRSCAGGLRRNGFQALAQHLAPLSERRARDRFEGAEPAGKGRVREASGGRRSR